MDTFERDRIGRVFQPMTVVQLRIFSSRYRFQDQDNRTRWQEDKVTDMVSF